MPLRPATPARLAAAALAALCLSACTQAPPSPFAAQAPTMPTADPLRLDPARYQLQHIEVDGQRMAVRAYEGIVYVRQPVDAARQQLNLYVPDAYFQPGGRVGRFTAQTAPIFLPNQIGGYMPAAPGTAQRKAANGANAATGASRAAGANSANEAGGTAAGAAGDHAASNAASNAPRRAPPSGPGTIAQALARGYVVASPGARGRTEGTGKAPAAIVDLKAAVRWLRHNDAALPGDAEKIISNGTSAGGALSALLGASGNHPDYADALRALGAADARDDIFAVSAYCPITNLEHADAAYEWQFQGIADYKKIEISMLDYNVQRKEVAATLSAAQQAASQALAPQFAAYINQLGLRAPDGRALTLDAQGNGPFKDHVMAQVIASAQRALDAGQLADTPWLRVQGQRVLGMDFAAYARAIGRQKAAPAFDALDLGSGENQLFGTALVDKRHFTAYAQQHSSASGAQQADAATVQRMNAMHYIGAPGSASARHWRLRHGTADRDTSLAIPVLLATWLQQHGHSVDLALPWGVPHRGDYDLGELFAWMERISTAGQ